MKNIMNEAEVCPMDLLAALVKKGWLVSLCALICAALMLLGTFLLCRTEYQSTVLFYISNSTDPDAKDTLSSSDMAAAKELAEYYAVILETRTYLDEVSRRSGSQHDDAQLKNMITWETVKDTAVLEITVRGADGAETLAIAQAIAAVLPEKIAPAIGGTSASVVEYPAGAEAVAPAYLKNTVLAFFAGLFLSALAVTVWEIPRQAKRNI